jgi:hypothetical protein
MTKQLREEFDKFMEENCLIEEVGFVLAVCHKSDERMQDMMDYIRNNSLQCKKMLEHSDIGLKEFANHQAIMRRALSYKGVILDENNNVVESEEDDN